MEASADKPQANDSQQPLTDHANAALGREPATLRINEIFHSIQGEGTRAGRPCVFVRLTGCHLRCGYCDTEYAFHQGHRQSIGDIVDQVTRFGTPLVQVTGGEPLLQPSVHPLMTRLCDLSMQVTLETSGACDISTCDPRVVRIVDLKTPGSGEAQRNLWQNIEHLTARDEVKFVITDRADFDWAMQVIQQHDFSTIGCAVLLSPAHAMPAGSELPGSLGLEPRTLAQWMLQANESRQQADGKIAGVRLQMQLHKLIWDPLARGV